MPFRMYFENSIEIRYVAVEPERPNDDFYHDP